MSSFTAWVGIGNCSKVNTAIPITSAHTGLSFKYLSAASAAPNPIRAHTAQPSALKAKAINFSFDWLRD